MVGEFLFAIGLIALLLFKFSGSEDSEAPTVQLPTQPKIKKPVCKNGCKKVCAKHTKE